MPRGFKGVRQASADLQARRDAAGSFAPPALYFSLDDGDKATVRFLEQDDDITYCYVHKVPIDGRQWGRDVPCMDQDEDGTACPGCEQQIKKSFKGYINLIWEDAPLYKKDKEDKLVKVDGEKVQIGEETQVALWTSGIQLFEELDEINDTFKGLRSRRFIVRRKGVKLNTKYIIKPEDVDSGRQPFSDEEKELAGKAYDINKFIEAPTYEEFEAIIAGKPIPGRKKQDDDDEEPVRKAKKANPFLKRS